MSKNLDKIFVLDTNVILHDATCIHHFENNEVVIPISVLEELDQFKRGNEQIHFNARDFLRSLDDLSTGSNNSEFNKGDGKIRVLVNHDWHPDVEASFQEDCPDHRIINCAYKLKIDNPDREVILVTKDTNMRLKSRSLGLSAEDYSRDAIEDLRQVYTGSRLVENVGTREIDELYASQGIDVAGLDSVTNPISNENFILRNGQKSILAAYDPFESKIVRVDKPTAYGIEPRNAEQSFAIHMLMDNRIQLVTLSGKAGTGKTLLALAAALEKRSDFRQIFLARPIVPLSNRDLGFLPGDIQSKLDPYMQPLYDNLSVIRHQFTPNDKRAVKIDEMLEQDKLQITPLAYIRGRSLQKAFFIVDEAQNLTPHEVKTVITRAGEGTKVIFTGDIHQIDHPYLDKRSNGLTYLISRMKGQDMFAHITLEKGERSELAELASNLL
ncbi:MAG: PhoH family protein [Candidatus Marinimicrobia bacterium]|jgi:PhoH-like ATPase|nr:PhoH family protein [Candidatus Neomarinimicrobiota bacterium]MBT5747962.1 PhoH family protein [Candidatus Neomarinimicrobiota bacterium]MBT7515794.1 PhoH family protein [Candidatus Neomarinimicrobiota bacterium]MBT7946267.1 PhoH family protein [Candidatus Neomarinimicrobiota bacterium]|tara:strand:- start:11050 stop:12369 length:1320 start_codon:yes stop_codon:yes gene_type:complete